jgi:galactoside O-acetyltransferase
MNTGNDVRISPLAVIRYPDLVSIGNRVAIDEFTVITTQLRLGSYIHIASHCSIIGSRKSAFVMEDFAALAAGSRIVCGSDDFRGNYLVNPMVPEEYRHVTYSTVTIKRFATLGTNTIVLPGVTIGEGAMVGAGSLVTKDLEPWGVYVGVPAKRRGFRDGDKVRELADRFLREVGGVHAP